MDKINLNGKLRRGGALPVKRTVNLAVVGREKLNIKIMIPSIILIVLAASLFSKYGVVDRLLAVSAAQSEAQAVQDQLDDTMDAINAFGEIKDQYAHYTFSGFTAEELNRADRQEVFELIESIVLPQATVSDWNITDNEVDLTITGSSLEQLNSIAAELEADERVDFCVLTTASTKQDDGVVTTDVTGNMTVYLVGAQEGETEE